MCNQFTIIKAVLHSFVHTKSSKSGPYYTFTAYLSSDHPQFIHSVAIVLDRRGMDCWHISLTQLPTDDPEKVNFFLFFCLPDSLEA